MDSEQRWRAIAEQRLRIADALAPLTPEQWNAQSLCSRWRVRDVAAHLTLSARPPAPAHLLAEAVRARGSFDAADLADVQVGREEFQVRPRELADAERDAMWNDTILVEAPEVAKYARKAGRTIPVAVLERLGPTSR